MFFTHKYQVCSPKVFQKLLLDTQISSQNYTVMLNLAGVGKASKASLCNNLLSHLVRQAF